MTEKEKFDILLDTFFHTPHVKIEDYKWALRYPGGEAPVIGIIVIRQHGTHEYEDFMAPDESFSTITHIWRLAQSLSEDELIELKQKTEAVKHGKS